MAHEQLQRVSDELDAAAELAAGDERDRLERKFDDSVTFLGSVPYEQVPALYHQFDGFVLPSHTEGLPRVLLEAQATGTPVIATAVGGVPDVIEDGDTGLLTPPKNPAALATTIEELVDDESLQHRLATRGRAAVVNTYSWDQMFDRYEHSLSSLLEEHE